MAPKRLAASSTYLLPDPVPDGSSSAEQRATMSANRLDWTLESATSASLPQGERPKLSAAQPSTSAEQLATNSANRLDRTLESATLASLPQGERPKPSAAQPSLDVAAWRITPSINQVASTPTHTRQLPLPMTLDVDIGGACFKAQYRGHGGTKVVYKLESVRSHRFSGKMLKLCQKTDLELELFKQLSCTGLYTQIYAESNCALECNSVGQPGQRWKAWVTDDATPLDQYLKRQQLPQDAAEKCIIGAVRCMLHAASYGHTLSDNALFNFGVLVNNIVIIDAGSRELTNPISKGQFTQTCLKRFWSKVRLVVDQADLINSQSAYRNACNMDEAKNALDQLWFCKTGALVSANCSVEQPALKRSTRRGPDGRDGQPVPMQNHGVEVDARTINAACPNVTALLDNVSDESLIWLTHTLLYGNLAYYTLSGDGYLVYHRDGERVSADLKLELLIKLTRERRDLICANPSIDILSEGQLSAILTDWKNDYRQWMNSETLSQSYSLTNQQWHQLLRKTFRSFLFHLVGCYEMTIFFLVAPFTVDNLDIFKNAWQSVADRASALEIAKDYLRRRCLR